MATDVVNIVQADSKAYLVDTPQGALLIEANSLTE